MRTGSSPASASSRVGVEGAVRRIRRERSRIVRADDAERQQLPAERWIARLDGLGSGGGTSRSRGRRRSRAARRRARRRSSRRITPPSGSGVERSIPAAASAAWLAQSAWWSKARSATSRPGATRSRSCGGRPAPQRRWSQPPPRIQPGARELRRPRRRCARAPRRPSSPASGRPARAASAAPVDVEMGVGQPGDRDLAGLELDPAGCAGRPASRARSAEPAKATLPSRIPTASTQPKPDAPANVAIRPVTRVSRGMSAPSAGAIGGVAPAVAARAR